jgi:DNA replication protein DnaD
MVFIAAVVANPIERLESFKKNNSVDVFNKTVKNDSYLVEPYNRQEVKLITTTKKETTLKPTTSKPKLAITTQKSSLTITTNKITSTTTKPKSMATNPTTIKIAATTAKTTATKSSEVQHQQSCSIAKLKHNHNYDTNTVAALAQLKHHHSYNISKIVSPQVSKRRAYLSSCRA